MAQGVNFANSALSGTDHVDIGVLEGGFQLLLAGYSVVGTIQ